MHKNIIITAMLTVLLLAGCDRQAGEPDPQPDPVAAPDAGTMGPVARVVQAGLCGQVTASQGKEDEKTGPAEPKQSLAITPTEAPVPLQKGAGFGFSWQVIGLPPQDTVVLTFRVTHPPMTRPDGETVTEHSDSVTISARSAAVGRTDCFVMTEDHELVAGDWNFAVYHKDTLLVERSFRVGPPQPGGDR